MPELVDLASIPAAGVVAVAAWRARALSTSGLVAAWITGSAIVLAAGWGWGVVLVGYFVAASALSKLPTRGRLDASMTGRDHRRDAIQVVANGGIPLLMAVASALDPRPLWSLLFVAALAGASADTWATEIGSRYGGVPRSIVSGRRLPTGLSGGVTLVGLLASLAGASTIAAFGRALVDPAPAFIAIVAGGLITSLADSVLGATVQVRYHCPTCDRLTEQRMHRCGRRTTRVHGASFVSNDVVNASSIVIGLCAAALLA